MFIIIISRLLLLYYYHYNYNYYYYCVLCYNEQMFLSIYENNSNNK